MLQSAAMEYYEGLIDQIWKDVSSLVSGLRKTGRVPLKLTRLHKSIGEVVTMRNAVAAVLHLLDRPELIWEDDTMDSLYGDLRAVFDLPERFQAVRYKLETIQDTLETVLDVSRDSRLFIVEVSILLLIAIDIVVYFV